MDMNRISLRRATIDDAAQLHDLQTRAFAALLESMDIVRMEKEG